MSTTGAFQSKYQGGLCYALCQETFNWFHPKKHLKFQEKLIFLQGSTHQLIPVGKDAIMPREESMIQS